MLDLELTLWSTIDLGKTDSNEIHTALAANYDRKLQLLYHHTQEEIRWLKN